MRKQDAVVDIFAIALARIITMLTSMLQAMILSRVFDKFSYGTYSQTLIVMTMITNITGFGLSNAVKYFISKNTIVDTQQKYFNTILEINIITGCIGGALIWLLKGQISTYFSNPVLESYLIYVFIRPMIANLVMDYQNLFISKGMSALISVRNVAIGILQLCITLFVALKVRNIKYILILFVVLDIMQIVYFIIIARKRIFPFHWVVLEKKIVTDILKFALPMAFALMIGTLNIEIDKLMIGHFFSTDNLALYTNMSKELPFSFIASAITTVTFPKIVYRFNSGKVKEAGRIWQTSISIGFTFTALFCILALLMSKELILFLYSDKYLGGQNIFNVYIFIQMIRFTYFGTGLNAAGKSHMIFICSCVTLILNIILNFTFIQIFGFIGPAYATLISTGIMGCVQIIAGCRIFDMKLRELFVIKETIVYVFLFSIIALALNVLKRPAYQLISSNFIMLVVMAVVYTLLCMAVTFITLKKILYRLKKSMED